MKRLFLILVIGYFLSCPGIMPSAIAAAGIVGTEELLFQEIPGVITKMKQRVTPVSVTTITAADIKITPARNLLDLMEVYVPGALYMHHSEGNQPGIRGIISDRRNKFILLVNGKQMTVNGHNGVETEIDDWDLGDIEKIEIIRGPGSVTYGPGAIMGVINITTKSEKTNPGFTLGESYMSDYNTLISRMSYGKDTENYGFYMYGSVSQSKGLKHPRAYRVLDAATTSPASVNAAGAHGYWGEGLIGDTANYLKDSDDIPHLKLYADANFFKECRFWVRFLRDGTPTSGFGSLRTLDGTLTDREAKQNRQITFTLENEHTFNQDKDLTLKSIASYMSTDTEAFVSNGFSADRENGSNYNWNYSEDSLLLKSILNMKFSEICSGALGFSYEHSMWGPGWGDDPKDFRMGDSKNIVNGPDSHADSSIVGGTKSVYAGSGWDTDTVSLFSEANMNFHPKFNLLGSFRFDKNEYSKLLFSPRLAIFSDWQNLGSTKLILQKSLRMSTAEQLFEQHQVGSKPIHEEFKGAEFIYNPLPIGNFTPSVSMFYNQLQVLGWNKTASSTILTGDGALYGIEPEVKYTKGNFTLGLNHSYVDWAAWQLGNEVNSGGFSYSELRLTKGTPSVDLRGSGENINNWSKNTTKLFSAIKLLKDKLTLHANAQIYWGFEGIDDQLDVVQNAARGTSYESRVNSIVDEVKSRNAGDLNFRLNLAASYEINKSLTATLSVMNLLMTNNKRYYYDSCSLTSPYPSRVIWVEEPTVIGASIDYKF